jgi:hypothetical protein
MRQRGAGQRIGVGADVRLRQQVADRIVGERLLRRVGGDRRRGEAVQIVVGQRLGEALVGIGAGEHVAEHVIGIGEALDRVATAREDRGEAVGEGIEALGGDDAVAGGLRKEPQLGIARVRGPINLGSAGDLLAVAEARIAVGGDEAGGIGDGREPAVMPAEASLPMPLAVVSSR